MYDKQKQKAIEDAVVDLFKEDARGFIIIGNLNEDGMIGTRSVIINMSIGDVALACMQTISTMNQNTQKENIGKNKKP